jgi:tRNA threonylcarbamoyladenosine biosynthesis protein TsaE
LSKGFAEGLGINPDQVQSPTYTYLNVYDHQLLHLDMYRLESFEQLVEKGILDQMNDYPYILIEWPKWIDQLELGTYLHLNISKS